MKVPLQITFRNMRASDELEDFVRESAAKLETFCPGIMSCRVAVEVPHRHRRRGNLYHVRIDLRVPDDEIVVTHEPSLYPALQDVESAKLTKTVDIDGVHKHARVAIREAFDAARRRLQDYARRRRGAVKAHEPPAHGRVVRLAPDRDHGWILTPEGREIYFHRHSVLDDAFDQLAVGSDVAFVEAPGEEGPQASTVRALGKHHYT